MGRRVRMALVGGGFIGRVHALAARLDGRLELVAGALSSDPAKGAALADELGIAPERSYVRWEDLVARERERADGAELVAVATPNDTHAAIAGACLAARLPVVCEKPLTVNVAQAEGLARTQRETGAPLALMHNYTGYPLVRQMRAMVAAGELGELVAARAAYLQGSAWRSGPVRAPWRLDPARNGPSGAMADIGTHAYNLLRHVTQRPARVLACRLKTYAPGAELDDYGAAQLELEGGALATVVASKVSHGRENDLSIHVDGTKGSLEWRQEEPDRLLHRVTGEPMRVLTRDPRAAWAAPEVKACIRLPAGHPEAFFEAFANVYTAFLPDVEAYRAGRPLAATRAYPDLADGVDEMRFVQACLEASQAASRGMP